jgi:hypothetical protein
MSLKFLNFARKVFFNAAKKDTPLLWKIYLYFGFKILKVYMQGKMKNFKFRNLERNDLP